MNKKSFIFLKCKIFVNSFSEKTEWDEKQEILKIYIKASRENGKANKNVIEIVSKIFKIKKWDIFIKTGFTTTLKLIQINIKDKNFDIKEFFLKNK